LQLAAETGEEYFVAELTRLRATYLMALGAADEVAVETCLRDAVVISRRQGARTLELRASVTLGQLLYERGAPDAARALVQPIYEWFTEGHDLHDMIAARDLLERLDSPGAAGRHDIGTR
jgi:predicted ATPase